MTREFSFKLATIGTILLAFMCVSFSQFLSIFMGKIWPLFLIPIFILLAIFAIKVLLKREFQVLKYFKQAEVLSPLLATVEKYYFYSYASFEIITIAGFLIFTPILIDIPVSYGLARLGFHELAERFHSLDYAWDGINKCPFAVMAKGFPATFHKFDVQKLENAVLKVYGENSIQYGFWLTSIGNDEKFTDLSARKCAISRAIKVFDAIGEVQESLLAKSSLAEMEAKSKNFAAAQKLASEIALTVDLPRSKCRDERLIANLASTYQLLGVKEKAKALEFEVGKLSANRERGYLLHMGYLPLTERIATLVVLVANLVGMFFCLIYGFTYEYLFWKNKRIARTSRNSEELISALKLLVPLSLAKRKQKLADEYSQRLLDLVQREA